MGRVAFGDRLGERRGGEPRDRTAPPPSREPPAIGGAQLAAQLPVRARHEAADRLFAPHQHRQRGGLDPADRVQRRVAGGAPACCDGPGGVHADQPVGLGARPRGIGERVELGARPQRGEPLADRVVGQRRDPQPADRRAAACVLIDVAEDQLALAAGVARVDHRAEPPIGQEPRDRAQLRHRVGRRPQPELRGQHRQRIEPPGSPPRVVRRRLIELDQVADAPRDHVAIAGEPVLAGRPHAEHAREISRHGRLLCDDQLHPGTIPGGYVIHVHPPGRSLGARAAMAVCPGAPGGQVLASWAIRYRDTRSGVRRLRGRGRWLVSADPRGDRLAAEREIRGEHVHRAIDHRPQPRAPRR